MPVPTTSLVTNFPRLFEGVQQDAAVAQAASGVGQVFELPMDWNGLPTRVRVEVTFAAATGVSLDIEGSDDSAFPNPAKLQTVISAAGTVFIIDKPVRFIRTNLTAITGGNITVRFTNGGKG